MNNNQYRRQEFNRRRIYKGATTYCQSYECPIFQNLLLENQQLKEQLKQKDEVIEKIRNHTRYLRSLNTIYFCDIEPLEEILDKYKGDN